MRLKPLLAILALATVVIAAVSEAPAQCRSRRVVRRTYHRMSTRSYSSYRSSSGGYVVARPVIIGPVYVEPVYVERPVVVV